MSRIGISLGAASNTYFSIQIVLSFFVLNNYLCVIWWLIKENKTPEVPRETSALAKTDSKPRVDATKQDLTNSTEVGKKDTVQVLIIWLFSFLYTR